MIICFFLFYLLFTLNQPVGEFKICGLFFMRYGCSKFGNFITISLSDLIFYKFDVYVFSISILFSSRPSTWSTYEPKTVLNIVSVTNPNRGSSREIEKSFGKIFFVDGGKCSYRHISDPYKSLSLVYELDGPEIVKH